MPYFNPNTFIIHPSENKASPMPLESRFSHEMGKSVWQNSCRFQGLSRAMGGGLPVPQLTNGAHLGVIFLDNPIRAIYGLIFDPGMVRRGDLSPIWAYFSEGGSHSLKSSSIYQSAHQIGEFAYVPMGGSTTVFTDLPCSRRIRSQEKPISRPVSPGPRDPLP